MPAPFPARIREAAIADYVSGIAAETVAARHGCSSSVVLAWVRKAGHKVRDRTGRESDVDAYDGGWVLRGAIKVPLQPVRRAA